MVAHPREAIVKNLQPEPLNLEPLNARMRQASLRVKLDPPDWKSHITFIMGSLCNIVTMYNP